MSSVIISARDELTFAVALRSLRLAHEWGKAYNSVVMHCKVHSSYNVWETATARRWRSYTSALCWWRDERERDHLVNLGVDRRILLKWLFKT